MTCIDHSPRPSREFMSDPAAKSLAGMVCESLPADHPFRELKPEEQAEVCRAAHYFAGLRG
jgi:hypothetical protein